MSSALCVLLLTVNTSIKTEMPPALAFGSHSSVFKEQPRTEPQRERCVTSPVPRNWLPLFRPRGPLEAD